MTYKILKLVSDYLSGGVYVNRLELGDSGLGRPVDIRFIQYPGWIENTHSVWFGVDGRDDYYQVSGSTGGMISTSDTGDLVFFDPSNNVGRTLTQLYSGGASLWTDTGSYTKLTTPRTIDLQTQKIIGVTEIVGSIFNLSATYGNPIKLKTEAGYTTIEDVSINAKFAPTQIDLYQHTVMNAKGIFGATTAGGDLNLHSTTNATKGRITLSGILDYSNGVNTHEIWMDGNDLKFKDINYAGGKTLAELVAGGGAGLWQVDGTETQLITAQDLDLRSKGIYFDKGVSNTRIYPSGDNIIINPTSTVSSIGLGGILSADYGIVNCNGITMHNTSSVLDMNYGTITNSDDITLYDGGSISPKLSLKVPIVESSGGVDLFAYDNLFYIQGIGGGNILLKQTISTMKTELYGDLDVIGDINLTVSNITGITYLKPYYSTGLEIQNNAGTKQITLSDGTYSAVCNDNIDMMGNDIIRCKTIKGQVGTILTLDFLGDATERIYYTTDSRLAYRTATTHAFAIGANVIAQIDTNGLNMNTGKYIKSESGDLEFRVASGSSIKFTAV